MDPTFGSSVIRQCRRVYLIDADAVQTRTLRMAQYGWRSDKTFSVPTQSRQARQGRVGELKVAFTQSFVFVGRRVVI